MPSNTVSQQYYTVVFKIPDYKVDTEDILNLYYARIPLQRTATLCYLTVSVPIEIYNIIHNNLEKNIFAKCFLEIWTVDIHKNDGGKKTKLKRVIQKNYLVSKIKSLDEFNLSKFENSPLFITQITLVNEVIFYLEKSKRYSGSVHNITAYEALQGYNKIITKEFGDGVEFMENIPIKYINKFKYETITMQGYNDLILPFYIIKNYKALQILSYYFFDDFYYENDSKKDITVFFNTITNDNQYKKINVMDTSYSEFQTSLQILKREAIIDTTNFFSNDTKVPNLFIETFDGQTIFERAKESFVPSLKIKESVVKGIEDLSRFNVKNSFQLTAKLQQQANSLVNLYTPDTIEYAKLRFQNYSDLIRNKISSIWTFSSDNCFIDVIQFNKVYNLDSSDAGNYNFLPISIINKFSREDNNSSYLRSSVKFQAIKFNI